MQLLRRGGITARRRGHLTGRRLHAMLMLTTRLRNVMAFTTSRRMRRLLWYAART